MLSLDISYVVHVPSVQVVLAKQKVVAQYHPRGDKNDFFSIVDGTETYQVILSDLIPSRHPNLAEFPFAGASKTNLIFSQREKALIS